MVVEITFSMVACFIVISILILAALITKNPKPKVYDILILILLMILIYSSNNNSAHLATTGNQEKIIEGCEYIKIENSGSWVHKGNCINEINHKVKCE